MAQGQFTERALPRGRSQSCYTLAPQGDEPLHRKRMRGRRRAFLDQVIGEKPILLNIPENQQPVECILYCGR